ncbi:MAG TPA: ABC transporter ATP-binding protein [Calidithermus sp.]|nr:ABC transporter ATP-binding protein [Calidithermus sp.]
MSTLLDVRGVSKRFGGLQALNRVSLQVEEGEILGLIGPNGAGKTTFFATVSGFLRPDDGRVIFAGRDLVGLPPYRVARLGLARTFQLAQPFAGLTVADNVMVGALVRHRTPAAARRHADGVLALTRLHDLAARPAHALSVGLRKRLELARALATGPRLLLLDEVMAGLNPAEVEDTLAVIREIRQQGVTVVLIEHVMAAVMALCDRVAVLHHGELLAVGPPAHIARDERVVDAYLGEAIA